MCRGLRSQRLRLLLLAGLVAPAAMAAGGLLLAIVLRGEAPDLRYLPGWRSLLLGALTAGLSMGLVYVMYRSSKTFERALKESGVKVGEEALRMAGYPVMFVVVSAAGIGEEILFRGGLQPSVGVIPAALLFGFSHGGWRREMWAYALAASCSGALFGYAYHFTGDLYVPIVAHVLHNVAATVLLGRGQEESAEADGDGIMPWSEPVAEEPDPSAAEEADSISGDDEVEEPLPDPPHDADGTPVEDVDGPGPRRGEGHGE